MIRINGHSDHPADKKIIEIFSRLSWSKPWRSLIIDLITNKEEKEMAKQYTVRFKNSAGVLQSQKVWGMDLEDAEQHVIEKEAKRGNTITIIAPPKNTIWGFKTK